MLYREDLCNTPVHRQVYEQVRITLGQTLLSNPLSLEEINGVLIMSDHVVSACTLTRLEAGRKIVLTTSGRVRVH